MKKILKTAKKPAKKIKKVVAAKPKKMRLPPGWKFQATNSRMRKPCSSCEQVIDGGVRVVHSIDTYPFPTTETLCPRCAVTAMRSDALRKLEMVDAFSAVHVIKLLTS